MAVVVMVVDGGGRVVVVELHGSSGPHKACPVW